MRRSPWTRVADGLVVAALLLLLVPWHAVPLGAELDPSWRRGIAYAFRHGWRFGPEIVFTYGPWGWLLSRDQGFLQVADPALVAPTLAFWTLLALGLGLLVTRLRRGVPIGAGAAMLAGLVAAWLICPDTIFLTGPLLLLLVVTDPRDRLDRIASFLLVAVLALAALIKLLFGFTALMGVLGADLTRALRRERRPRQRLPVYTPAFAGCFLVSYHLAGQHLADLPVFLASSAAIISGYGEAMQSSLHPVLDPLRFLALVVPAAALWIAAEWRRGGLRRGDPAAAIRLLLMAMLVWLGFKSGLVRDDAGHNVFAWGTLTAVIALHGLWVLRRGGPTAVRWATPLLLAGIAAIGVSQHRAVRRHGLDAWAAGVFGGGPLQQAERAWGWTFGSAAEQMRQSQATFEAGLRAQMPLPALSGTVDLYPDRLAWVTLHGLDYRPRPVFQSYAAYTESLARRNAEHLASPAAADTILFDIAPLDDRLAAEEDGLSWPLLFARYTPEAFAGRYLLLRKRAEPRALRQGPETTRTGRLGERLVLPGFRGMTWATIDVQPTPLGRLAALLFRPPKLTITLTLADGTEPTRRFLPGVARGGLLLSPLVDSTERFLLAGWGPTGADAASPPLVTAIRIDGGSAAGWCFRADYRVGLSSLALSPAAPIDPLLATQRDR